MGRRLFELILTIRRKCQESEEQIQRELGLSPAEFNALLVLEEGREITGGEFAGQMSLSLSRSSRVLSKLIANGYVKVRVSPRDHRATLVALTVRGRKMRQRMFEQMETCEQRIGRRLDPGKRAQMRDSLELLESAL
jgi:DNA-binding MarR family transcriptional regulator